MSDGDTFPARFRAGVAATPAPVLRRAFLASLVMLIFFAIQAPILFEFVADRDAAAVQDFLAFHAAAERALAGDAAKLYEPAYFSTLFVQEQGFLWFYPPTMFLLIAPFGALPYGAAKFMWVSASMAGIAAGAYWLTRKNTALAFIAVFSPAAWSLMKTGQLSAFFALFAIAGMLLSKTRPIVAGVLIGLLTVKPQYGLLIPAFLIATRSWRAICAATAMALVMAALSAVVFGIEPWLVFLRSLTGAHAEFMQLSSGTGRITLIDTLRNIGWENAPSSMIYALVLPTAAAAIIVAARRHAPHRTLAAMTLLLGFVTAPYIWTYDWLLIAFAILILVTDWRTIDRPTQSAMAVLWFLPIASYLTQSHLVVPFMWTAAAVAAALFYGRLSGAGMEAAPLKSAAAR